MRRLLPAALALLLVAGGEVDGPDVLIRREVSVPDGAREWVHLDVPSVLRAYLRHGDDDLRLVGPDGKEIERLVYTAGPPPESVELSEYTQAEANDGRVTVGVMLPGPGPAPARLRLIGGAADSGAVVVDAGVRPDRMTSILVAGGAKTDGADRVVPLPPFVGRLLHVTTAARRRIIAEWDAVDTPRVAIQPEVVDHVVSARGIDVMLDLRVRRGPDIEVRIEVEGDAAGAVTVYDARHPDSNDWRVLPFMADGAAPPGRVHGHVVAAGGAMSRWVRFRIPLRDPQSARIAAISAYVPARRLWFPADAPQPVTLLAGRMEAQPPTYPMARAMAAWGAGEPAEMDPVPWAPGLGPAGALRQELPSGRPFPWAETLATAILVGLLLAWAAGRKRETRKSK